MAGPNVSGLGAGPNVSQQPPQADGVTVSLDPTTGLLTSPNTYAGQPLPAPQLSSAQIASPTTAILAQTNGIFAGPNGSRCVVNAAGTGLQLLGVNGVYSPAVQGGSANSAADTAAILAAALAAYNAGGGVVQLPALSIYLASTLPIYSGVSYQGAGWTLNYLTAGTNPDGNCLPGAGTWLYGNGTFHGMSWNAVDGSSALASYQIFCEQAAVNCNVTGIGFYNCLDGLHIGSNYNAGAMHCNFDNLAAVNCQGWGFWFENGLYNSYGTSNLYASGCVAGQSRFRSSAQTTAPVNCRIGQLRAFPPAALTSRGVVIDSQNATQGGIETAASIQIGRFSSTPSTQACTMAAAIASTITNAQASIAATNTFTAGAAVQFSATVGTAGGQVVAGTTYYVLATGLSGSAFQVSATPGGTAITFNAGGTPSVYTCAFTVTDGTQFAQFMPVVFSATANGFTQYKIYFVQSVNQNSLILGTYPNSLNSNIVAPTGNSAVNVKTYGMAGLEVISNDGPLTSIPCLTKCDYIQTENAGAAAVVLNNIANGFIFGAMSISQGSQMNFCFRNALGATAETNTAGFITATCALQIDYDGNSPWLSIDALGNYGPNNIMPSNGSMPGRIGGTLGLSLTLGTKTGGVFVNDFGLKTNNGFTYVEAGSPTGQNVNGNDTTSGLGLVANLAGTFTYNGASNGTATLPTPNVSVRGLPFEIVNASASSTYAVTSPAPGFNNIAARTTITINAGASMTVKCESTASGTYYWAVTAFAGTYSGGVVSSI